MSALSIAFGFIKSYITNRQELKKAKQSAEAKLKAKKADKDATLELTDAEWEAIAQKGLQDSWKDEYITIIITIPIPLILFGAILSALGFDSGNNILQGTLNGIKELKALDMDYGFLMKAVVLAAIGLKIYRA